MRELLFSVLIPATLFTASCARKDIASSTTPCPGAGAFVRKVNNLVGTVFYDSTKKSYGIQAATSMDSADMGISCNLPTDYQKEGLKVRFSGSYYAYDKPVTQPTGYQTYYLTVDSISRQTGSN